MRIEALTQTINKTFPGFVLESNRLQTVNFRKGNLILQVDFMEAEGDDEPAFVKAMLRTPKGYLCTSAISVEKALLFLKESIEMMASL